MSPLPQSTVANGSVDEPDPTDVANAIHLDQLESSDAIHDITSFQDIDIGSPPKNNNSDNNNDTASVTSDNTYDQYGKVRRPKKLYYIAPMIQRYKYWMGGCTLSIFLLLLAIGLSARSTSMLAQHQQEEDGQGSEEVGRGKMSVSDAPPPPMTYTDDIVTVVDETGEEVLNSNEDDTFTATSTTETIEGVNWYQTTNAEYISFLSNNAADIEGLSAVSIAKLFCKSRNNAKLCPYDIYCPNGYGQLPYPNGPPTYDGRETETDTTEMSSKTWSALDEQQWSPYLHPDDVGGNYWVQVGYISPILGGHPDNGYGQCYTAGIWNNQRIDEYDGSMEDEVDESNRRYVLCCE